MIGPGSAAASPGDVPLDVRQFRLIEKESGPNDYYSVVQDPALGPVLRARYQPPWKTAVYGISVPDGEKQTAQGLRWSWRAHSFPRGGNECAGGVEDSAAVIYITWKRSVRWHTLKYVWSSVGPKGAVCAKHRNPISAMETVILESGGAVDEWRTEQLDLKAEFRNHFADGKADASVPDLIGVAVMSDGDQTHSESAADYGSFVLTH